MSNIDKKKIMEDLHAFINWCKARGYKPSDASKLRKYMRTEVRNGI